MENKNSQVLAGASGAVGGAWQQNPPASQVMIRKYGRGMNSNGLERRYLYLYATPFDSDSLEGGVQKAVDAINRLLAIWEPPIRRGFFRSDMWWEHVPCQHCLRRMEYENRMWQAYVQVWRRNMCLRHWMVYHLAMVVPGEPSDFISNRPISVVADDRLIQFDIETVNYKYRVWLNKERAEMEVNHKGNTYKFSFKNHLRGYPYNSSYMNIAIDVYNTLELFRDFLVDYVQRRRVCANVVINDVFTIPPEHPDAGGCNVCRL
jgi:hypothetical protein